MHIYTLDEVVEIASRLASEGMGISIAIIVTGNAYGYSEKAILNHIEKQNDMRNNKELDNAIGN